jgi:hypothetical protein
MVDVAYTANVLDFVKESIEHKQVLVGVACIFTQHLQLPAN